MYHPIAFAKEVLDLLKEPTGEAVAACEITTRNRMLIVEALGPQSLKYVKAGDFVLEFETATTVVPRKEFLRHYAFTEDPKSDMDLTPVKTIKPL